MSKVPGRPRRAPGPGGSGDQTRLMAKIALMYYERGARQTDIAQELHVSQSKVSRLLARAAEVGIVRTTVTVPAGVHTDLEDALERTYGLREAVVVDVTGEESEITPALGSGLATYLEATLTGGEVVGISSWSATLLSAAAAMRRSTGRVVDQVIQVVGGVGEARVQVQASRLISLFADATGADPVFMPAPGLLGSPSGRQVLVDDPAVRSVMESWSGLTTALVGIGSLQPSPLLRESGNSLADRDQEELRAAGAVGDICLRYFDAGGTVVKSGFDERVVGIGPEQFRAIPRRVGVAGGERKHDAILGALRGGWLNVLVTDVDTASRLVDEA
ncbi:sugar-binding transcriptional regulator [Cellulomonas hominis]|uniref:sugar-binding transcriptional regulator n=1 Tax=Cellulomonas hominis TaxID=156981 RepID=UPI00144390BE|nr:sugar-binding domain-containing protein [Cellulomonas hominis]NKY09072.1 MarR family transcriptional regulator [Cellulomonas hominis]